MNAIDIIQTIQIVTETGFWTNIGIGIGIFAGSVTIILATLKVIKKLKKPE